MPARAARWPRSGLDLLLNCDQPLRPTNDAAGWLATTLAGAATGAAAGGIVGALVRSGVPHEEAEVYEEGVRRGGTLVSVQADETDVPKVGAILDRRVTADWRTRRD